MWYWSYSWGHTSRNTGLIQCIYCSYLSFLQYLMILKFLFLNLQSLFNSTTVIWASLVAQSVKNLPAVQETQVQTLGWEDPMEKEMATHSSSLAWKISWTVEPGGLQSMGSQRVGCDSATNTYSYLWKYQTTWPASWETYMQVTKQQLELDMEQQIGSK